MARRRLTRDHWSIVGLAVLAVVTAVLVFLAVTQHRSQATQAAPAPVVTSSPAPSASPTPTASPTPEPRAGMAGIADIIHSPDGASLLVIGDGSGNQDDEWVSLWARDHLADGAAVSYRAWDRNAGEYTDAVHFGSSGPSVAVWNASISAPTMSEEPQRIVRAWQDADVVLLSYGHRRAPSDIGDEMDAVLGAVRAQNAEVPVVVMVQNPDRASTEAVQRKTTLVVQKWAEEEGLPMVDVYSAFVDDPARRNELVEADGSPTPTGSQLWADALSQALRSK